MSAIGQGRLDEAIRYFEETQRFRERVYPDELHPERLHGLNNLAYALMLRGDTARARPMVERSLRGHEKVYGADHVNTLNSIHSLAEIDRREGRLEAARAGCERALVAYEGKGLRRSPAVLTVLLTLAQVEVAENRLPAAERLLREMIEIAVDELGYDSPAQIDATEALEDVLRRNDRTAEAETLDTRVAEIRRKSGQKSSPLGSPVVPLE